MNNVGFVGKLFEGVETEIDAIVAVIEGAVAGQINACHFERDLNILISIC